MKQQNRCFINKYFKLHREVGRKLPILQPLTQENVSFLSFVIALQSISSCAPTHLSPVTQENVVKFIFK
jgi:hypothetical protein